MSPIENKKLLCKNFPASSSVNIFLFFPLRKRKKLKITKRKSEKKMEDEEKRKLIEAFNFYFGNETVKMNKKQALAKLNLASICGSDLAAKLSLFLNTNTSKERRKQILIDSIEISEHHKKALQRR